VVCSLGASRTIWLPWQVLAGQPLFENIIPSRFLVVTYLCLAVQLGLVVDHAPRVVLVRDRSDSADGTTRSARWGANQGERQSPDVIDRGA
jgi:hypothetical protein